MVCLICLILGCIVEISCSQICHNDQGNLTLSDDKYFLTKLIENGHTKLFVDKQEELSFVCQNNQGINEIKLFESADDNIIHIYDHGDQLLIAKKKKIL